MSANEDSTVFKLRTRHIGLRAGLALICCVLVGVGSWLVGLLLSGTVATGLGWPLGISMLLGLAAGAVGWWIGGYLTKPFGQLTQVIQDMKNSHAYGSVLEATPFKEVNVLIAALNSLFLDLMQHREETTALNASLERRVRERTLELVLINDSLQNEIEERCRLEEEREKLMTSLLELASTDYLTQTFNRRTLFHIGTEEFNRCRSLQLPLTVIMLDIDQFKQMNDTHGHAAGDEILHRVAQHLRTFVRENDIIGRYGGDEFVFVLPDSTLEGGLIVAERLRISVLESGQSTSIGAQLHLSASLGVATLLPEVADFSALVMQADHAHYIAKRNGKNQVSIAPQSLRDQTQKLADSHLMVSQDGAHLAHTTPANFS